MNTSQVLEMLVTCVPRDTAFVVSLGRTSEEAFRHFPNQTLFLDSMGDVSTVACGVALGIGPAHPVVALDTDGSHLMGLALLPTLGALASKLPNLSIIVLDNGIYESAGGLISRYIEIDWPLLAKSFGIELNYVKTIEELEVVLRTSFTKFLYIVTHIQNDNPPPPASKTIDGIESKYRFIRHLERIIGRTLLMPAVKS